MSNTIWEKPGPLGFGEWERVRLHPHFTERAFAQSPALAPIGVLAGSHHERLDGSGYHRGTRYDYQVAPSEYSDEGSRVVVKGHFGGKNKGGAVLDTDFEHMADMRDGKVVRFKNKPDDAAAWIAGWTG